MKNNSDEKRLKAVLFDFDGTLSDTLALCLDAAHRVVEPLLGRAITDDEILSTFGPSEEGAFRQLVPESLYTTALNSYVTECKRLLGEYPDLFPGIRELLRALKEQGLILGLVTGRGKITADDALKFYDIYDIFDQIEAGVETGPSKPEGLRRILDHFQLSPEETVYIGDAVGDILACRQVGIPVLTALWSSTAALESVAPHLPDATLKTVEELKNWLEARLKTSL